MMEVTNANDMEIEKDAAERAEDTKSYCICRGRDDGTFMICCDKCEDWYHGRCVQIREKEGRCIDKYVCPLCSKAGKGHTTYKGLGKRVAPSVPSLRSQVNGTAVKRQRVGSTAMKEIPNIDSRREERRKLQLEEQKRRESEIMRQKQLEEARRLLEIHQSRQRIAQEEKQKRTKIFNDIKIALETGLKSDEDNKPLNTSGGEEMKVTSSLPEQPPVTQPQTQSPTQLQTQLSPPIQLTDLIDPNAVNVGFADPFSFSLLPQQVPEQSNEEQLIQSTTSESPTTKDVSALAQEIEDELYRFCKGSTQTYLKRYRTLTFNLQDHKNRWLRTKIFSGELDIPTLVKMDSQQLASQELKDYRKQREQIAFENVYKKDDDLAIFRGYKKTHKGIENMDSDTLDILDNEYTIPRDAAKEGTEENAAKPEEAPKEENGTEQAVTTTAVPQDKVEEMVEEEVSRELPRVVPPIIESKPNEVKEKKVQIDIDLSNLKVEKLQEPEFVSAFSSPPSSPVQRKKTPAWTGRVTYQQGTDISIDIPMVCYHINGAYVEDLLPAVMHADQRLSLDELLQYLPKIDFSSSRSRTCGYFEIANSDSVEDRLAYVNFFNHLKSINRGGVFSVTGTNRQNFKEMYIFPLAAKDSVPQFIEADYDRELEDMLIGVFLTSRNKNNKDRNKKRHSHKATEIPSFLNTSPQKSLSMYTPAGEYVPSTNDDDVGSTDIASSMSDKGAANMISKGSFTVGSPSPYGMVNASPLTNPLASPTSVTATGLNVAAQSPTQPTSKPSILDIVSTLNNLAKSGALSATSDSSSSPPTTRLASPPSGTSKWGSNNEGYNSTMMGSYTNFDEASAGFQSETIPSGYGGGPLMNNFGVFPSNVPATGGGFTNTANIPFNTSAAYPSSSPVQQTNFMGGGGSQLPLRGRGGGARRGGIFPRRGGSSGSSRHQ